MSSLAHPRHRQMAQGYVWLNQRPSSLREQVQRTIVPQVVVPIKLIAKAFGDHLLVCSYFSCFPMALVSQLQLWHIGCPESVQPVGDLHFTSHRGADAKVEALSICGKVGQYWVHQCRTDSVTEVLGHIGSVCRESVPRSSDRNTAVRTWYLAWYPISLPRSFTRSPPLYTTSARQTLHGLQARSDPHLSKQSREQQPLCNVCFEWSWEILWEIYR